MKINLHIERLVLDGLPVARHDSHLVQAAVETELARLLMSESQIHQLNFWSGAIPSVVAPSLQLTKDSGPVQVGQQIAQSVFRGIK